MVRKGLTVVAFVLILATVPGPLGDSGKENEKMVPVLEIIRLETSKSHGTIGVLKINKKIFGFTLEPPDEENKPNISSIPAGQYLAKKRDSPKHGLTFTVQDVTDRTYINFHPGYTVKSTEGCIILGDTVLKLKNDNRAMANSGKTFDNFMEALEPFDFFHLTISEIY